MPKLGYRLLHLKSETIESEAKSLIRKNAARMDLYRFFMSRK